MPENKVKLITNPNSDLGRAWRISADLRPIVQEFGGADWAGTVYPTHAIDLARQAAEEGYELVVAAGGDGTIHEVINGLMQVPTEQRPRLGIVPLGTGNDFAHAVGMPEDPNLALRKIFMGKPKPVDSGKIEDNLGRCEYWDNTVGIGFDATVTTRLHKYTYLRGTFAYLVAVLQTIILNHETPFLKFSSDEENWNGKTFMLVLCNGDREGGGFRVAPDARVDDGIIHYATVGPISRPFVLRLVPEVMRGTHGRFSQVRMGTFRRVEIESDMPLMVHMDGEIFSGFGVDLHQLVVEVLPGAIEVMG